jgi:hypothetical protein
MKQHAVTEEKDKISKPNEDTFILGEEQKMQKTTFLWRN